VPETEARRACWFLDSKGLIVRSRWDSLSAQKRPYAHEAEFVPDLATAVRALRPTALIGVAGAGRAFSPEILGEMARQNDRPIIFALSNPTSKSECTAEEAYVGTQGRAIFASGSPFRPVNFEGRTLIPGQGNNVYVFPGVGLGVLASQASRVTDDMFLAASEILARSTSEAELASGRVYPSLYRIRQVSIRIAAAVAGLAWDSGLAAGPRPPDLTDWIQRCVFEPDYYDYV
jgi:malate dehydrogenase (oxaloacetate-decarboxylating)(NADP+)